MAHAFNNDVVPTGAQTGASDFIAAFFVCPAGRDISAGTVGQATENGFLKGRHFADSVAQLGEGFTANTGEYQITDPDGGEKEGEGNGTDETEKVVQDIRSLADDIEALYLTADDPKAGNEKPSAIEPEVKLEDVRKVLANKSREGHTAEVRALIQKYGADQLSKVSSSDYPALLKEAEGL